MYTYIHTERDDGYMYKWEWKGEQLSSHWIWQQCRVRTPSFALFEWRVRAAAKTWEKEKDVGFQAWWWYWIALLLLLLFNRITLFLPLLPPSYFIAEIRRLSFKSKSKKPTERIEMVSKWKRASASSFAVWNVGVERERERKRGFCVILPKGLVVSVSPLLLCAYLYKHEIGEHSRRR